MPIPRGVTNHLRWAEQGELSGSVVERLTKSGLDLGPKTERSAADSDAPTGPGPRWGFLKTSLAAVPIAAIVLFLVVPRGSPTRPITLSGPVQTLVARYYSAAPSPFVLPGGAAIEGEQVEPLRGESDLSRLR